MSLVNWKKKNGFPSFSSMVENFFQDDNGFFRNWPAQSLMPAVNVKENDSSYSLEVVAPGKKKEDFVLKVEKGVLTISSENQSETEETKENYTRKEFSYDSFSRSFWLPENVSEDEIKAEYKEGVLNIVIPKKEVEAVETAKKIEIS